MTEKNKTLKQLSEILNMPPRQIQFYSDILPGLKRKPGRGKSKEILNCHIPGFLVCRELASSGVTISKIEAIINQFYSLKSEWWDDGKNKFIDDHYLIYFYNGPDVNLMMGRRKGVNSIKVLLDKYTSVIVINVSNLMNQIHV